LNECYLLRVNDIANYIFDIVNELCPITYCILKLVNKGIYDIVYEKSRKHNILKIINNISDIKYAVICANVFYDLPNLKLNPYPDIRKYPELISLYEYTKDKRDDAQINNYNLNSKYFYVLIKELYTNDIEYPLFNKFIFTYMDIIIIRGLLEKEPILLKLFKEKYTPISYEFDYALRYPDDGIVDIIPGQNMLFYTEDDNYNKNLSQALIYLKDNPDEIIRHAIVLTVLDVTNKFIETVHNSFGNLSSILTGGFINMPEIFDQNKKTTLKNDIAKLFIQKKDYNTLKLLKCTNLIGDTDKNVLENTANFGRFYDILDYNDASMYETILDLYGIAVYENIVKIFISRKKYLNVNIADAVLSRVNIFSIMRGGNYNRDTFINKNKKLFEIICKHYKGKAITNAIKYNAGDYILDAVLSNLKELKFELPNCVYRLSYIPNRKNIIQSCVNVLKKYAPRNLNNNEFVKILVNTKGINHINSVLDIIDGKNDDIRSIYWYFRKIIPRTKVIILDKIIKKPNQIIIPQNKHVLYNAYVERLMTITDLLKIDNPIRSFVLYKVCKYHESILTKDLKTIVYNNNSCIGCMVKNYVEKNIFNCICVCKH
jgi:hypothetical protein